MIILIRLIGQKVGLIENLNCIRMMLDSLGHPYIRSTQVAYQLPSIPRLNGTQDTQLANKESVFITTYIQEKENHYRGLSGSSI